MEFDHERLDVYRVALSFAFWAYQQRKHLSGADRTQDSVCEPGAEYKGIDYEHEHRFAEHAHDDEYAERLS